MIFISLTTCGEEFLMLMKEIQQYRHCCEKEGYPVPRFTDFSPEQWRQLLGRED